MNKKIGIIHYRAAVCIFQKWLNLGLITEEELLKINSLIAGKYGLPINSIYR